MLDDMEHPTGERCRPDDRKQRSFRPESHSKFFGLGEHLFADHYDVESDGSMGQRQRIAWEVRVLCSLGPSSQTFMSAPGRLRQGCLALVLACISICTEAQALKASAAQVKAAYLLKVPGFVEWPAAAQNPGDGEFVISVLGADDVMHALEDMSKGVKIMGKPVRVTRFQGDEASPPAQMFFLGPGERKVDAALARARADGGLVVSDRDAGLKEGAALHFVEDGGRVRFEAAPNNAMRYGVKLSARLLSVAARVEGATP